MHIECIQTNKFGSDDDLLCHAFLDIADYPNITTETVQIRDFPMKVRSKYANNKQYKKEKKQIAFDFDVSYNKMTTTTNESKRTRKDRESLILDNTKILTSPTTEMEESETQSELTELSQMTTLHYELIDDDAMDDDESVNTATQSQHIATTTKMDRKNRGSIELDSKLDALPDNSTDDDDGSPIGRPGDTEDFFVAYDAKHDDTLEVPMHKVRLTKTFSNDLSEMVGMKWEKVETPSNETSDIINPESYGLMMQRTESKLQKLIDFDYTNEELSDFYINTLIDTIQSVVRVHDMETVDILIDTIRKLNNFMLSTEVNEDIIECMRDIRNKLMSNNRISNEILQTIFVHISCNKQQQYLISDGLRISTYSSIRPTVYIFEQLLKSEDADNIEYALDAIYKMETYLIELDTLIPFIVKAINNNNVNVKRLAVQILSKFSKSPLVQREILEYGKEILRILSLIDFASFVNVSYNLMHTRKYVTIADVHWNEMNKYLVQNLKSKYDDEQQDVIWSLINIQSVKENILFLEEDALKKLIDAHLDNLKEHGLVYADCEIIAKSKQILAFQSKSECSLIIQRFVRSMSAQREYEAIKDVEQMSKERHLMLVNESSHQLNDIQHQNMTQNQTIIQQQREIKRLQQKTIDQEHKMKMEQRQNAQNIESLKRENETIKQQQIAQNALIEQQKRQIEEMKQIHLFDKQQFAQNMMSEMNKLRNELRKIGKQQQLQQEILDKQKKKKLETSSSQTSASYFGSFW